MIVMSTGSACDLDLLRFLLEVFGCHVGALELVPRIKFMGG